MTPLAWIAVAVLLVFYGYITIRLWALAASKSWFEAKFEAKLEYITKLTMEGHDGTKTEKDTTPQA